MENNMDINNYKLGDWLSTGNKLRDAGLGAMYGLASVSSGNKYMPYMTANWAGNGLARTGIGYMMNPKYRDYASGAQMVSSLFDKNLVKNDSGDNRLVNNILGRLSGMGGNIGNWANRMMGNNGNSLVRQNIDNYVNDVNEPTNSISDYVNRYVKDIDYNDNTLRRNILDATYYNAIPGMRGL